MVPTMMAAKAPTGSRLTRSPCPYPAPVAVDRVVVAVVVQVAVRVVPVVAVAAAAAVAVRVVPVSLLMAGFLVLKHHGFLAKANDAVGYW